MILLTARSPPLHRELIAKAGIQVIPQHISHQIEGQDREDDEDPGEQQDARRPGDVPTKWVTN